MKKGIVLLLTLVFLGWNVEAQDQNQFNKMSFAQDGDTLLYRILLPENFSPKKAYPVVLFLHGAGERGSDNEAQLIHGSKLFLDPQNRKKYPAIVLFPQCPRNSYWSNVSIKAPAGEKRKFEFQNGGQPTPAMKLVIGLMEEVFTNYKVKTKQVYVGGLSMGGMGTFELASRKPEWFAAAFPICGGGNASMVKNAKNLSWWIFHGAKDDVVPPIHSEDMEAALKEAGAKVKLTIYPEANHNSWDAAFAEPGLMKWIFSNKKKKG